MVLDGGGTGWHYDGGRDAEVFGGEGDALGVVAGGTGDDAFPAEGGGDVCHFVVGAPDFEGEDGLEVFALEEDFVGETGGEVVGVCDGGFGEDVVDARGEDEAEVLFGGLAGEEEEEGDWGE